VALDGAVGVGGRETVNVPLPESCSGVLREPEVLDPLPPEVLDPLPPEVLDPLPPEVLELGDGLLDDGLRAPAYIWNCPEQAKYPTEKVTLVFPWRTKARSGFLMVSAGMIHSSAKSSHKYGLICLASFLSFSGWFHSMAIGFFIESP